MLLSLCGNKYVSTFWHMLVNRNQKLQSRRLSVASDDYTVIQVKSALFYFSVSLTYAIFILRALDCLQTYLLFAESQGKYHWLVFEKHSLCFVDISVDSNITFISRECAAKYEPSQRHLAHKTCSLPCVSEGPANKTPDKLHHKQFIQLHSYIYTIVTAM